SVAGAISSASWNGGPRRVARMKKLDEVLKHLGEAATTPAAPTDTSSGTSTGLPLQDEETEPPCPRCGGSGFVRRRVPLDHPDFGRAIPCSCVANEQEQERVSRLQRYSNLGPLTR